MDQAKSTPDWTHLRAFLATADSGSLSAAARALGLTQPTLSRQVAALEDQLGVMLFERVGRRLDLTDAGRKLLPHARDMGVAAERVALSASGQRSEVSGQVRITASDITAATFLPKVVASLREIAPQLHIDVIASNDIQDLMRREADIAIRHQRPEQPDLVARLVLDAMGYFYASKSYLDKHGRPTTRAELAKHDWVSFGDVDRMVGFMVAMDIPVTPESFRSSSENGMVAWELGRAGLGICPMDIYHGERAPDMEAIMPDELHVTFPIWLVTHREIHTSPRIRLVFDVLAEAIAAR
ncbi:LysR family transcriptional regulator [Octadecabacter sp. R77987]|uniref:LysR family transcriptional regulator n=1 Tax=Octadecabacter sp. R77987 TaxID=3093874 RepID=UPI003670992A